MFGILCKQKDIVMWLFASLTDLETYFEVLCLCVSAIQKRCNLLALGHFIFKIRNLDSY